jgi:hypothetical protein
MNSTRLTLPLIQQKVGHLIAHLHLGGWQIHHQLLDLDQEIDPNFGVFQQIFLVVHF